MKKLTNKKGFTLAELLVVVAIIAVLVAVSIPIFTSKLEKAREATDIANMRAAKAAAVTEYLNDTVAVTKYYDAKNGTLVDAKDNITGYGKGTTANAGTYFVGESSSTTSKSYDPAESYADKVIKVSVTAEGIVTFAWE